MFSFHDFHIYLHSIVLHTVRLFVRVFLFLWSHLLSAIPIATLFPRFREYEYLKIAIINYNRLCYKLRHKTCCRQRDYKNLIPRFVICCLADIEMSRVSGSFLLFRKKAFVCCNKNFNFFFSLITPCINVKATVLSLVFGQP